MRVAGSARRIGVTATATTVAATLGLVLAACQGGDGIPAGTPPPPTSALATPAPSPSPTPFDPPLAFAPEGTFLGVPATDDLATDGAAAFFRPRDSGELAAVDLATGAIRWSHPTGDGAPVLTTIDGRTVVFIAEQLTIEGAGTSADRHATRVSAVYGDDGSALWNVELPQERLPADARLVGATGDHLLARGGRQIVLLDLATGAVAADWRAPDQPVRDAVLVGEVVVLATGDTGLFASEEPAVVGLAATDGRELWRFAEPAELVTGLGGDLVAIAGAVTEPDRRTATLLVSARTGEVRAQLSAGHLCRDGTDAGAGTAGAAVVCENDRFYSFEDHVVALDRDTGETLWELPGDTGDAAERAAPDVLTVRRGAVYAEGEGGAVILDAATGAELVAELPIAPTVVVAGYGLVRNQQDGLTAYPATG